MRLMGWQWAISAGDQAPIKQEAFTYCGQAAVGNGLSRPGTKHPLSRKHSPTVDRQPWAMGYLGRANPTPRRSIRQAGCSWPPTRSTSGKRRIRRRGVRSGKPGVLGRQQGRRAEKGESDAAAFWLAQAAVGDHLTGPSDVGRPRPRLGHWLAQAAVGDHLTGPSDVGRPRPRLGHWLAQAAVALGHRTRWRVGVPVKRVVIFGRGLGVALGHRTRWRVGVPVKRVVIFGRGLGVALGHRTRLSYFGI